MDVHRRTSGIDEKVENIETSSDGSVDLRNGDEALKLIDAERVAKFSEEYNLKLRRKLDMLIPPICAAVYFTQFLDKTSLNYASIMGFPITGQHYNLVSMAFYLGYFVWEFPTTYISQKLRVAKYLGANIIVWGIILMLHSVANSFSAFFALRFLLGMCEACVSPILILIISMFYKKNEQARRISWYFVMLGISSVFGGFVAYGVSFYVGNKIASWKIVFLLLGALAIVVGICVLIWLPDSPVHAHFLTQEERVAALERVRDDQGGTEGKVLKKEQIREALTDIRTWLIVLITLLSNVPNGGMSNFSNLIIKGFGYTTKQTLILSTPAGAITAGMTIFCGWYADKKNERMLPVVFAVLPTILGAALLIGFNHTGQKGVLLFAIYLSGTFGSVGTAVYSYNASNTSGHTKKSTVNALTLVAFSIGNIVGSEIFQPKDAPEYIPGKIAIMVLLVVQVPVALLLRRVNLRENKKKRVLVEEIKKRHGWSDEDVQRERNKHAFADLTDKENPYFVYTA